jgi:hypothetical protein
MSRALKLLAEGVESAVRAGDVEEAVACAKAMHDAIGAQTVLDYEAAVEALELFVASHEAGYPASLVMSDAACTHARAALARLRDEEPAHV